MRNLVPLLAAVIDLLVTTVGRPRAEEPLMQHWFHLVQQRNSLVQLESELLIM